MTTPPFDQNVPPIYVRNLDKEILEQLKRIATALEKIANNTERIAYPWGHWDLSSNADEETNP